MFFATKASRAPNCNIGLVKSVTWCFGGEICYLNFKYTSSYQGALKGKR